MILPQSVKLREGSVKILESDILYLPYSIKLVYSACWIRRIVSELIYLTYDLSWPFMLWRWWQFANTDVLNWNGEKPSEPPGTSRRLWEAGGGLELLFYETFSHMSCLELQFLHEAFLYGASIECDTVERNSWEIMFYEGKSPVEPLMSPAIRLLNLLGY